MKNMKNKRSRWCTAALAALGALWLPAGPARAAGVTDSLTVTITPTASYVVTITTAASGANLGSVALGLSTQTVTPSTVTITSSYAYTGLQLQGAIASAGTAWSFAPNTAAAGLDQLSTWAVFTDTGMSTMPAGPGGAGNYWVGTAPGNSSNVVSTALSKVGGSGNACPGTETATNPQFVAAAAAAGYKKMGCLKPFAVDAGSSKSHLWLFFTLPPASTNGTSAQNVTFTLTAGTPN